MKLRLAFVALVALVVITYVVPAVSQTSGLASIRGTCRDAEGKPIADAQVVWHNEASGRTYNLKTNKKGEYFSIGIEPTFNENGGHKYTVTLSKDGKVLETKKDVDGQTVNGEKDGDIDLQAEQ